MHKRTGFVLFVIFAAQLFGSGSLFADTLLLKTGQKIEGKIIKKTDTFVRIEENGIPYTYFTDEINQVIEAPADTLNPVKPTDTVNSTDPVNSTNPTNSINPVDTAEPPISASPSPAAVEADHTAGVKITDPLNPDYIEIAAVAKNCFSHNNDKDLTEFSTGATEDFKKHILPMLAKRNADMLSPAGIVDFKLVDLVLNENSGTANVSFKEEPSKRTVNLKKEADGWKIDGIERTPENALAEATLNVNTADPEYSDILKVTKNYFTHRDDKDPEQRLAGLTDEFKKVRMERLKTNTTLSEAIDNFKILNLDLKENAGTAVVLFDFNPSLRSIKVKKEAGGWKIDQISNSPGA
jgi:hypothetical protein